MVRGSLHKTGVKNNSKIDETLKNLKKLLNNTISDTQGNLDLDIQFAEIISLLKISIGNLNYRIEALTLILSELLKKNEFNQAAVIYLQYSNKLNEYMQEIDDSVMKLRETFLPDTKQLNATQKIYQSSLENFEKNWRTQKKEIQDKLKNLKKSVETGYDKFIYQTKRDIEKNLSALKLLKNNIQKKFSKFSELIEQKKFVDAEKIIDRTQHRVQTEYDDQKERIDNLPSDVTTLLGDLISKWKRKLLEFRTEIPKLLKGVKEELYTTIIDDKVSELRRFSIEIEQQLSNLSSLIERNMLIMAEELYNELEKQTSNEFNKQKRMLKILSPKLNVLAEDLVKDWQIELVNTELSIKASIKTLKKDLEAARVKNGISTLEDFSNETSEILSNISELLAQEKYTIVEKNLTKLKNEVQSEIQQNKLVLKAISQASQTEDFSPEVKDNIDEWKVKLNETERELNDSISDLKNEYTQKHIPHLQKKLDLFIKQNINLLNVMVDEYERSAWNQLGSFLDNPNYKIHHILEDKKTVIIQEFKNKDEHIQLVFARYENYPLKDKIELWANTLKKVQNRFNDIWMKVIDLTEDKDLVNQIVDKYYEIAQPAYGYKVPIKDLSESMETPPDKLENLFVDLISNKVISGEIDPITKVIVLPPRVTPEEKVKKEMIRLRCMVCNLVIDPSTERIIHCPRCNSPAHHSHLIEWLRIKGTCPNCKQRIKML